MKMKDSQYCGISKILRNHQGDLEFRCVAIVLIASVHDSPPSHLYACCVNRSVLGQPNFVWNYQALTH